MIVGYYEDGPNLVSMAMNGWGAAEPAWWLNLQAHPDAVVELAGGIRREVLGRAAVARSVNGCGSAGASWTRTSTATPRDARTRRRSSSSSRARWPAEPSPTASWPSGQATRSTGDTMTRASSRRPDRRNGMTTRPAARCAVRVTVTLVAMLLVAPGAEAARRGPLAGPTNLRVAALTPH